MDSNKYSEACSEVLVLEKENFNHKYLSPLSIFWTQSSIHVNASGGSTIPMFPRNFEHWLSGCHPSLIPKTPPVDALIVRKGIDALSALMLVRIFLPSMDVSTCSLGRADT